MLFRPGDLVRVKGQVKINGVNLSGSVALVVGLEHEDFVPKDLHETMNREFAYIIIVNSIETYVWEEEIEKMEEV